MYSCMRFNHWKRNMNETPKTVFVKFLVSYLVVLLLPVIIGILLFNRVESVMIENAKKSNTVMLEQVRLVSDNRFKEVEQLSLKISLNQRLNHLMTTQQKVSTFEYIDFIKELKKYKPVSTHIDDFYVYFSQSDVLLSPTMKTNSSLFFNHIKRYENSTYEEIMSNKMSGFHLRDYFPSEKVNMLSGQEHIITFVQSLPYGEVTDIRGFLMVHIDEKQIREMLQQLEGLNQGVIYIADENKEVMMSTSDDESAFEGIKPLLSKKEGSFEKDIGDQAMIASYTTSEQNGWTYVSLVPREIVLSGVNLVKSQAYGMLILFILIGVVVSYYLAKRNYQPIHEVVNTVIGQNRPKGKFSNEMDLIKESIVSSMNKQSQFNRIVAQQEPVIRANFILRVIRGQVDIAAMPKKELDLMGVSFHSDYFSVMIIQVDKYCQFTKENTDTKWVLTRFIISNLSEELFTDNGYTIEIERDKLIILTNHPNDTVSEKTKQLNRVKELNDILVGRFGIKISVAISQIHQGLNKVSECYGEAIMALDYRVIKGPSSITFYNDIKNNSGYDYHYPVETEVQILNFARNGDSENVEKLLNQVFINNVQQEMTPEISKCLSYDLVSTWVKLLSHLSIEDKKRFIDMYQPFKVISTCNTVKELQEKIKFLYDNFCHEILENQSSQGDRLYKEITNFIGENYHDNMLSLGMIADHFGMNSSYLSTFFKKQGGLTITDFITKVRIEESKSLLSNRKLTISEIATKVGYANSVGLIRVFKKVEGVTPGQYREIS
ncbi:AraC family transcriptional regulator [Mesobacillus foraminis]|uniref:AraC family transcriptional regulator n=1 Tax=Mesobacillus foraminis TaxID=279826 RepID=UPI001BE5F5E3|nr:AraC family transcriptional regulator [Mesobacillus foraminis]MBT2758092.1 AraC family transcriptional regulator [Mesobacillus foraminis]